MRTQSRIVLMFLCCAGFMGHRCGPRADDAIGGVSAKRLEVPGEAVSRQTLEEIKEIFRVDYAAATSPQTRLALARRLLAECGKTSTAVERWVLVSESMRLASDAGDVEATLEAIRHCTSVFNVDADEMMLDGLAKLAVKSPASGYDALARASLELARRATDAGESQVGTRSLAIASAIARKTKNRVLMAEVTRIQQGARDEEREAKALAAIEAKVRTAPNDPEICLEAGRFFCFKADDWKRGLPLLAKGSDVDLARLAVAEANVSRSSEAVIALADAWWDWADRERGAIKAVGLAHAAELYAAVMANTQGLDRTRIEKRIQEAQSQAPIRGRRTPLADLKEESAAGVAFGFSKDGTFRGKPFTCCGQAWPKALQATTSPAGTSIRYVVPAGGKRLVGKAGVFCPAGAGPGQNPEEPIAFEILVNGQSAWKSPLLSKTNDTAEFDVHLHGATTIELRTVSKSPGSAWSAWLNPEIVH